jgi:hypothetical protein
MLIWKSVAGHELRPDGHGEVGEVVSHVTRAPFDAVSLKSESETAVRRSAHEGPRQTTFSTSCCTGIAHSRGSGLLHLQHQCDAVIKTREGPPSRLPIRGS